MWNLLKRWLASRPLRRAAEMAWQADAADPRSSPQLSALGIEAAADEASSLLPRRARLDGPTPVGDNPDELRALAEQLLLRICVVGAPSRLLGLRALVAELCGELEPRLPGTRGQLEQGVPGPRRDGSDEPLAYGRRDRLHPLARPLPACGHPVPALEARAPILLPVHLAIVKR